VSLRNIGIVYRKELIDSLRDRRTLISMIVVPLLLMPLLTIGLGVVLVKQVGLAREEIPTVMVLGGEDSPKVRAELGKLNDIRIVPEKPDYAEEISSKQIRAAVEIPKRFDAKLAAGEPMSVKIYMYEGELKSGFGADRLQRFFRDLRDRSIRERLEARRLPENLVRPFDIRQQNVAPPEKVGGAILGGLVPYFVILLCLTGAMYPAMDLTAGEKERGTIETILCSPVSRTHLVLGKFLMVLTASIATVVLSVSSMAVSFGVGKKMLQGAVNGAADAALQVTMTGKAVVSVFFMVLPLAVMFSAALLAISLFAKSFKEAQSYISPLMVVVVLPAVAAVLPGVELNATLALVPVLNTSLVSKEIMSGTYHWNYIALIFASSCVYAVAAIAIAVKLFQREDVLFRT
jgi:sodium transport system permease protein